MVFSFKAVVTYLLFFVSFQLEVSGQAFVIDGISLTSTAGLTITVVGDLQNQNGGSINNAGTIEVSGNWTNNATNSVFSTASGIVEMRGTSPQTIGGTNPTVFNNLTLNNTASTATRYQLSNSVVVRNILNMNGGDMNLSTHSLSVGTSAASIGSINHLSGWLYGGTLSRWIDATTIPLGSSVGFFPIGSATEYRPVQISAPADAPVAGGTISISHTEIPGNSVVSFTDINTTIDRLCNSYWTIASGNGLSGGTYDLRVDGGGFSGITDYTLLRLVLPGYSVGINGPNLGSNSNPQVVRTGLSISELSNSFHFGYPADAALPVELISFNARPEQSQVKVNWITATEINSDYFTVERSEDGKEFYAIETIKAAGTTSVNTYYTTIDPSPLNGLSYYRLVETDLDGSQTYCFPVSVRFNTDQPYFELYVSRQFDDKANVTIHAPDPVDFNLNLYSCTGKLIFSKSGRLEKGDQNFSIPLSGFEKGMHIVSLITSNQVLSKKIL
ncbi:MAG: hypothetical protein KA444_06575 [Bacteroidia bacterium]|nr:hypothetical protein [Bacteroidia bacterium]